MFPRLPTMVPGQCSVLCGKPHTDLIPDPLNNPLIACAGCNRCAIHVCVCLTRLLEFQVRPWIAATARPKRIPHQRRAYPPKVPRCQGKSRTTRATRHPAPTAHSCLATANRFACRSLSSALNCG